MEKEKLNQIKHIKKEIEIIENQMNKLEPELVTDKVTGSSPYFPYIQRSFQLEGIDMRNYERKFKRLHNRLMNKKNELLELQENALNFIYSINNSLVRQIMTLKYIDGMSWSEVANTIGGNNTVDSVRKISERYLEKN